MSSPEERSYQHPLVDMSAYFLDEKTADVYFVRNDERQRSRVPAHKMLLSAKSAYFHHIFYGQKKNYIEITDIEIDALHEFLEFFYFSEVKLSKDKVVHVLRLAIKYDVPACLKICEQFLIDTLSDDDIFYHYALTIELGFLPELKTLCESRIGLNTQAVFASPKFLARNRDLVRMVLEKILDLDYLSCSEFDVFKACMSWVLHHSSVVSKPSVQEYLGELFYKIRFRSMSNAQLFPRYEDLFSPSEYLEIIQMTTSKEFQSTKFNGKLRKAPWWKVCLVECQRKYLLDRFSLGRLRDVYSVQFSSNQPLLFGEFVCSALEIGRNHVGLDVNAELETDVTIIEHSPGIQNILHNQKAILRIKCPTEISLSKLVLVKPGFMYEIQLKQFPRGHLFENRPLKTELTMLTGGIRFEFHDNLYGEGSNLPTGLIHTFKFDRILQLN